MGWADSRHDIFVYCTQIEPSLVVGCSLDVGVDLCYGLGKNVVR